MKLGANHGSLTVVALAALLSLLPFHASAQIPEARDPVSLIATSPGGHFEFHIDPWMALHHFAFHLSKDSVRDRRLRGRVAIRAVDRGLISDEFGNALEAARKAYLPYVENSLLFDVETRALGKALIHGPEAVPDRAVRAALIDLMPHYQAVLWPVHKARSEAMLVELLALLESYEAEMTARLAGDLESVWPSEPIRVDLIAYANWAGAYTDNDPDHIHMSSTDEDVADGHAFEILFHEALHARPIGDNLEPMTDRALEAAGMEDDRLWHNVLFYISGTAAKDVLGEETYRMYIDGGLKERSADQYDAIEAAFAEPGTLQEKLNHVARILAASKSDGGD